MYRPPPGIKNQPIRRWNQSDRVFFGHGACHILAGVFLSLPENNSFHAVWIKPRDGMRGNHIFVTNTVLAFDFHGYSSPERLYKHHLKGWGAVYPNWDATIELVAFDLLSTHELNQRNMMGPCQYYNDPIPRAHDFINRFAARRIQCAEQGLTTGTRQ